VRGFLRGLPDNALLTLVGRLATEYLVRKGGAEEVAVHLHESIDAGLTFGKAIVQAQAEVVARADSARKN
jgi:hypothetical protein